LKMCEFEDLKMRQFEDATI